MASSNVTIHRPCLRLSGFNGIPLETMNSLPMPRKKCRRICVTMSQNRRNDKRKNPPPEVLDALPDYVFPQNMELPPVLPTKKKRPYLRPINLVLQESRRRKKLGIMTGHWLPPRNGLLVPNLIPVAHKLLKQNDILEAGVSKLMDVIPVRACSCCKEIHIGASGHLLKNCIGSGSTSRRGLHAWITGGVHDVLVPVDCFHVIDRLGPRIHHMQRYLIPRLPAITELCIQAGVDHPDYPIVRWARRSGRQVGNGRAQVAESHLLADYLGSGESEDEKEDQDEEDAEAGLCDEHGEIVSEDYSLMRKERGQDELQKDLSKDEYELSKIRGLKVSEMSRQDVARLAERTLVAYDDVRKGVQTLMKKYTVRACGYCSEVHVGPRGHKVKLCGAHKHQQRDGQHGWQEAALGDVFPPNFVWHVPEGSKPALKHELRNFYGQAPAVVELCVQAGARIPHKWSPFMRIDTVIPGVDERDFVF